MFTTFILSEIITKVFKSLIAFSVASSGTLYKPIGLVTVMGCLHDPANVQQTSSKCIQSTRELLDVCWTFSGSCKHPTTQRFYYSAYHWLLLPVPLLNISRHYLMPIYYTTFSILDVFNEKHYLHFESNIPLSDISITKRFRVTNSGRRPHGALNCYIW